jgi:hypothetical protein
LSTSERRREIPWEVLKCGVGDKWRKSVGPHCVRNDKVLRGGKEERNILYTIKRGKAN